MNEINLNEAIALLKADLVWSPDFENIRESLLTVLLATDLAKAKLAIVHNLLREQCLRD